MDRRAAGALLALAACIACSAAAPTTSNHTALDLYEGASDGCYYNFQHYGEGDRIMTNEPCLNCTCHNRMLMCYLRVCPFTKPIGQDCTVEKRADQCCPIVTCPDVPVDLLTSTSTTSPAEYGATGLGKLDKYGCSINGKYFPEGSKVPPTPNKPCEHCYCIRNMTTCVMQECTLHVDGCTPIYHKDVCCPIRYSCDHSEDEIPLLDDMSTTVRPTPGFLLTTTTMSPVTQMSQDCVHNDQIIADGASITTEKACEHCYCMKGDIVCVVQECGAPMENEGKNCTSLPPREGQCCPDTYICEGDELSTDVPNEITTEGLVDKLTTLSPPRRSGDEGSGYRNEPSETTFTENPSLEPEVEGSGEESDGTTTKEELEALTSAKPFVSEEITTDLEDNEQYIPVTTKANDEKSETSTMAIDEPTQEIPKEVTSDLITKVTDNNNEQITSTISSATERLNQYTTEAIDSLNTVPDVLPEKESEVPHEQTPHTLGEAKLKEPQESDDDNNKAVTMNAISDVTSGPDNDTPMEDTPDKRITDEADVIPEQATEKEDLEHASDQDLTTTKGLETVTDSEIMEENETPLPEEHKTTNIPLDVNEQSTTEPNLAQNTVISAEEENEYVHTMAPEKTEIRPETETSAQPQAETDLETEKQATTQTTVLRENEPTAEPDKGLNTIPSEVDEQTNPQPSLMEITTSSVDSKTTEPSDIFEKTSSYETEKSPTSMDTSTETHITKVVQNTVTTEPSFRKEDEATENSKPEFGSTTIKTEFVDEGFIPTQDEKLSTGADVLSTDDEITTMVPEYEKESEATVAQVQHTTESILETSVSSETVLEKVADAITQPEGASSTEKSPDVTTSVAELETHEEPSRIPGEGDCLLDGVTYRNNTIVPSTSNCHTGCRCTSSVIKCDPIICSPPPDYMSNCQSIYDTPDSCCPTYICDHPRETVPPQSDNQMSGTETPIASPTIECRGDQCELSASAKPTPEPCISGDCGSDHDDKTETGECGPKGCADSVKEPVSLKPSDELSACKDGKCESPEQDCADGKCQSLPTSSQQPPVKSCDGDVCTMPAEENLSPQPCENGHDCNKIEMPVSQTSSDVVCVGSECDSKVTTSPSQEEICNEKDGCKPVEKITADCDNDKLCIRKETVPSKCTGEECLKETELPPDGDMSKLSTTATEPGKISLNEATETIVLSDEDNLYESTQTPITDHNKPTPTPGSEQEEKVPDTEEDVKEEPNTTKSTNEIEKNTDISTLKEEMTTLKPDKIQIVDDIETTQTPEAVNVEKTDKESTQQPDETSQEQTTSHPNIKEDITNAPEQYTTKISETSEEAFTTVPNVPQEYTDKSPSIQEEQTDQPQPSEDASKDKDIPHTTEEVEIKMPESEKEFDVKVSAVEKESTTLPAVNKEYGDNLTEMPETTKKDQETLTTYTSSEMPGKIETQTSEPISITATDSVNKNTEVPTSIDKLNDNEILNEDDKIKASQDSEPTDVIEDDKEKVSTTDDTKVPVVTDEQSYVPVAVTEDATEAPIIADHSDKPTLIEEDNKIVPDATETGADNKTPTQEPEKESTESTPPIDISTAGPIVVSDALTEQMNIETSSPVVVTDKAAGSSEPSDTITETPDIKIEHTNAPVVITEETTDTPQYGTDDTYQTLSPDEQDTKISDEHMDKTEMPINEKEKPILVEEELPEKPTDLMETVEKKPELIETDGITEPVNIEESVTESTEVSEDNSKTPLLIDETEPDEMTVNTDKSPTVTEHTSPVDTLRETDEKTEAKPVDNADTTEASPGAGEDHTFASLPTEHSNKPDISETHTSAPDSNMSEITETMPDEEKSVTKAPVTDVTKSDQEMISPESSVEEHTETTGTVIEKVTIAPTYESQVTGSEGSLEPNLITGDLVEESSKSPDEQRQEPSVTESQDSTTSGPQEVTTQSVTKLEETKKQTLQEEEGTTYHPSKQTMSEKEPTEVPETITTTESIEKITKSSENEIADDHAESFTSIPEQKPTISGTESPMDEITKLNEREQSEVPKETENNQAVEDTTSKQLEEVNTKPSPPESHTTETTPESESASIIPETDKATEPAVEDNVHNIASSDNVDETKDKQPDNLIPEKDDTIASAIDAAVMTTPTIDVTEAKDTLSTSQENTSVTEETTEERIEQSTTKEIDNDNLDFSLSSTKATTHSETESTERYETPTTPRSSEVLEDTSLSSKPISVEPNRRTEIGSAPETGMDVSEEKTTKMPYPTEHSDLSTAEPQTPVNDEQLSTVDTESVKPTSEKPEQPKTTESSNIEPNRDVDQEEHETDDTDKEHKIPETPMTSDSDSLGPVTEGEVRISSTENPESMLEIHSDSPHTQVMTETPLSLVTEPDVKVVTEKEGETETVPVTETEPQKQSTEKEDVATNDLTTSKTPETSKPAETTMGQMEYSETTPYLIELEEHTHKIIDDIATVSSTEKEQNYETTDEITSSPSLSEEAVKEDVQKLTTSALPVEEHTSKIEESLPTLSTSAEDFTQKVAEETSSKLPSVDEDFEKVTQNIPEEVTLSSINDEITTVHEKESHQTTVSEPKETDAEAKPVLEQTTSVPAIIEDNSSSQKEITTSKITDYEETTPAIVRDSPEKIPITESEIKAPVEDEFAHPPTTSTDESKLSTTKPTTVKQEDMLTPSAEDKYSSPEEKPTSEAVSPSANDVETKPQTEIEPTDEIPAPEDEGLSPSVSGYGEPDYAEEDQAFGPGTCRYGGKVYVSAQQIPRDDPCDFCFCFRSDIICLQQSCPPPIHGCHEEPIQGFCCPRYECPVSMATTVNVTTTTTTTTTTLPPHFPTHGYKGAAQRRGCQIKGHTYKVGEVVRSSSGPCLHCTCGGDGQMKCDPKACTPEPMLRQMIAAAVSAKRRR